MCNARFDRYLPRAQKFGARTLLFQQAVARQLSLTATELECFRLIQHEGPLTATDLTQETGLTRPSISSLVENLVKRGFIVRRQNPRDRRRWSLETNSEAVKTVDAIYAGHAARIERLLAEYSDEEFEVVLSFMDALAAELKDTAVLLS